MEEKYKTTTNYSIPLKASEHDYLEVEVEEGEQGRIRVKFLDQRWRTKKETVALLKEIINYLS